MNIEKYLSYLLYRCCASLSFVPEAWRDWSADKHILLGTLRMHIALEYQTLIYCALQYCNIAILHIALEYQTLIYCALQYGYNMHIALEYQTLIYCALQYGYFLFYGHFLPNCYGE